MFCNSRLPVALLAGALALASGAAMAAEGDAPAEAPAKSALSYSVVYTGDVTGGVGGGVKAGRYLDNLDIIGDLDLGKAVGWEGATLHAYVLNNSGGTPNDVAGALLGVDNIEVSRARLRLFEFWLDQSFDGGKVSVRGGLYNLNSEFYANDAASLFIAPAFGIGSELAASGPNGPSIFPSTSLGLRVNLNLGDGAYVRAAVLDARAGVMGDPDGVDFSFRDGVLAIAQAGVEAPVKMSVGIWRYSHKQADIRDLDAVGDPAQRTAQGIYAQAEHRLVGEEKGRSLTAFVRVGASDGDTTPFQGGWQAGFRVAQPFASRPDGVAAIGFEQGVLGDKFRANLRDQAVRPGEAETGAELTYQDRLTRRISIQPDLQWIRHAGGDASVPDRWVAALRFRVALAGGSDE